MTHYTLSYHQLSEENNKVSKMLNLYLQNATFKVKTKNPELLLRDII